MNVSFETISVKKVRKKLKNIEVEDDDEIEQKMVKTVDETRTVFRKLFGVSSVFKSFSIFIFILV